MPAWRPTRYVQQGNPNHFPGEGEDIRTHVLCFEQLMALVESGEAEIGPLVLSAFWLALNRDRLRADA